MTAEKSGKSQHVGRLSDFEDGGRIFTRVAGRDIVVLKHDASYYALQNWCLHMGGPVGEGMVIQKVECVLDDQKRVVEETFSPTQSHLVCPWHGYEYDIETGEHAGDPSKRLRTYEVVVEGEDVYVIQ